MKYVISDLLRVWPQYLLPQHGLSRLMYHLTRWQLPAWKQLLIKSFIYLFKVDLSESMRDEVTAFDSFNDFFTRSLKPGARPFDPSAQAVISPVDGYLSEFGEITEGCLIQAKGHRYRLADLLAEQTEYAGRFREGQYATLYLSPRNYHRIHMPLKGCLQQMTYVPGKLFAVNGHTTRVVESLFARNERAVTYFTTDAGSLALVMVGAIFVGNMETIWAGEINSPYPHAIRTQRYESSASKIVLDKGDEMGRFNMGSTVILLFEKDTVDWPDAISRGQAIRMGQTLARLKQPRIGSA